MLGSTQTVDMVASSK
jgi:hypothetical protein